MNLLGHGCLVLAAVLAAACAASRKARRPVRDHNPLLVVSGAITADAPLLRVQGAEIPYVEHRIELTLDQPVAVMLTSADKEFKPILECRPVDGTPDETMRMDARGLGNGARVDLLPTRSGTWILCAGDESGRHGTYRLEVVPILEREVLRALGTAPAAAPGANLPATFFCPIFAGRTYRVAVRAIGFPPHLAIAAPGIEQTVSNDAHIEFTAARTGQAVVQVASLSLANGPFTLVVTELW